jgi:hypothetical protein
MVLFHSYVSLAEGKTITQQRFLSFSEKAVPRCSKSLESDGKRRNFRRLDHPWNDFSTKAMESVYKLDGFVQGTDGLCMFMFISRSDASIDSEHFLVFHTT